MPVVTINAAAGATSFNLVQSLTSWAQGLGTYVGNGNLVTAPAGSGYAYTQWAEGVAGGSGAIFDGEFSYGVGGAFTGSVDNLYFGSGLSGSASAGYSLANVGVSIDLGGGVPDASFRGAIYSLTHNANQASNPLSNFTGITAASGNQQPGLFDFFGNSGTVQNGTAGNDVLYSFDGNDTLNGGAGRDRFVFDWDIDGALSSTIGHDTVTGFTAGAGGDWIDFRGIESAAFDTFAEVYAASSQVGANTVIDLGSLGSVTLEGVTKTALAAGNFLFTPAAALAEAA
ncbi:hemolysin [Agrobacterium larrymoorei]|uniref:hemolysin n=1 Tax=Agrobacterium larrymoorei TaxID=160699 RepID=UPI001572A017|nr:hemolysin [Agrobacterium larrymoorei]NTJ41884.1 hemolysin [Agrobacterium larrymoorei]